MLTQAIRTRLAGALLAASLAFASPAVAAPEARTRAPTTAPNDDRSGARFLRVRPLQPLRDRLAKNADRTPGASEITPAHVSFPKLLGAFRRNWRSPIGFFEELHDVHGPVARGRLPTGHDAFFLADSAGIDAVLKATDRGPATHFEKSELLQDPLASYAGRKGMFTGGGELWRKQRKELSFYFRPSHLQEGAIGMEMHEIIGKRVTALRAKIAASPSRDLHIDLADELTDLTLEVLLTTLFHPTSVGPEERIKIREAFKEITSALPLEIANPTKIGVDKVPPVSARQTRLRQAHKVMDDLVERIVKDRMAAPLVPNRSLDVLDAMLDTNEENDPKAPTYFSLLEKGRPIPQELRDQILTMVLAGHETTASSLAFAFHELGRSPKTIARLDRELARLSLQTRGPVESIRTVMSLAHGNDAPFLGQVVDETLRLYSPAWVVARHATEDTVVPLRDGKEVFVPKNSEVLMPLFVSQRLNDQWGPQKTGYAADEFHPERFDPSNLSGRNLSREDIRQTPFGSGTRVCMGEHFATLEARLILAHFLRELKIEPKNTGDPKIVAHIALKMADGMPARLSSR